MLGLNLLVAPVSSDDVKVSFYVFEDSSCPEEKWYTKTFDIFSLPLLVRLGTVTPINNSLKKAWDTSDEGLDLLMNGPLEVEVVLGLGNVEKTHEVKRSIHFSLKERESRLIQKGGIKIT
jgi:hypothetical protein